MKGALLDEVNGLIESPRQVLYDFSFPFWVRIPCVLIGLFFLYFAVGVNADTFFGWNLGLGIKHEPDKLIDVLSTLVCTPFSVVVGALFIFVWFARVRILYDPQLNQAVWSRRGYFRTHETKIPLNDVKTIGVYYIQGALTPSVSGIALELADGTSRYIQIREQRKKLAAISVALGAASRIPVAKPDKN
jgi:hypothetical protein